MTEQRAPSLGRSRPRPRPPCGADLQLLQDAHEAYLESLPAAQKRVVRATSAPEAVADEVFKTIVELEKAEPTSPTSVVDAMAVC